MTASSLPAEWPTNTTDRGYVRRKVPAGHWQYEHQLVVVRWAEWAGVKLPFRWTVRWLDGDRANNEIWNLVVIDKDGTTLHELAVDVATHATLAREANGARRVRTNRARRIEVATTGFHDELCAAAAKHGCSPARYAAVLLAAVLATEG